MALADAHSNSPHTLWPEGKGINEPGPFMPHTIDPSAYVHPSAVVEEPCHIGPQSHIAPFVHLMGQVMVGSGCHIGARVSLAPGVMLGHGVKILPNTLLIAGVIVENDVFVGPNTVVSPPRRVRADSASLSRMNPTLFKQGSCVGANVTIASGLTLGQHCFVEAGTVVDQPVPDFAVMSGPNQSLKGWRCTCQAPLSFKHQQAQCPRCGAHYHQKTETFVLSGLAEKS